jgi:carbon-monoxide dehydrogenase medium subunit
MLPAAFRYVRASSSDEAVSLLSRYGDEARLLSGGQSLLPLMKLRKVSPKILVDVGRLAGLSYVRATETHIAVGASTRYADLRASELLAREAPMVVSIAGAVADRQVRHRGTIGGSLANGAPAADLPAAILACDAQVIARGMHGERVIAAADFFVGPFETALRPDEMLTEVRLPRLPGTRWSYRRFSSRIADWATVAVAVVGADPPRVALVSMGPTTARASAAERALNGGASLNQAAELADHGLVPPTDPKATADYRRHLSRVLLRRALADVYG